MQFIQLLFYPCRICLLAATAALLLSQISFCQITFVKTYGDTAESHYDQGYAVLQTEDGGYIAAGDYGQYFKFIDHRFYNYGDVYLIKTDEYGDTLWTKTYGDTSSVREYAYSMDKTTDGGYIICAYTESTYKLWLIKINSQGDSIWSKNYPVGEGYCIRQTNDGGFVITGYGIEGKSNIYLLKIDLQGNTLWLKTYGDSGYRGYNVQQTSDNGYIIAASGSFIKTDSIGNTLWTKTYEGDPYSICETKDGGYLIAGEYTEQPCVGCELERHILLLRADSKGDTIWTKKINNGRGSDYAYAMKKTSDGGFIVAGETMSVETEDGIYLLKLDEEGNYQWSSVIGDETERNSGYDIAETSDSGYIITGFKWWGRRHQYIDLCLIKVNDKGQLTGLNETDKTIPSYFELSQNYPNPFNPITTIKYQLPENTYVTLKVYDILGREVAVLVNEEKPIGTYEVEFNASNLPSGIYFYQLKTEGHSEVKKMILMK